MLHPLQQQVLLEGVLWPQQSTPPGAAPPATPGCVGGNGGTAAEAEAALRQGAAALERQCFEPVQQRLDSIDDRIRRMVASLQTVRGPRCGSGSGSQAAGLLPADQQRLKEPGAAEL